MHITSPLSFSTSYTHSLSLSPLLSPFSGFTAIAAFLLTREVWNARAGLLAACFIAIVPGYISRSVAGSYDNEGIAIFALLFTYFLWLRSVKTGSVFWATAAAISYFYMVRRPTTDVYIAISQIQRSVLAVSCCTYHLCIYA